MDRAITLFLLCCLLGAMIFLVLLLTGYVWAYLTLVVLFGLFGVLVDWAKNGDLYD